MKSTKNSLPVTLAATAAATIAGAGLSPAAAQDACMMGETKIFAGNFAPRNWAFAQGQILPINQYQALYSILGTTYGGDGRASFALPDLRGRAPVGVNSSSGVSAGQKFGAENVTLTVANLPAHTHASTTTAALHGSDGLANQGAANGNALAAPRTGQIYSTANATIGMSNSAATATTTVSPAGAGTQLNNMQPSLGLNYIVCLQGVFPSRN